MYLDAAMKELQRRGTAQNVKVYKRHGAGDNLFGVSFANIRDLKKKIGVNQALADELWETGNSDARTLALMVADPESISQKQLESWMKDVRYYMLADMLAALVSKTVFREQLMKKWMASKAEFTRQVGYDILSFRLRDKDEVSDAEIVLVLDEIQNEIHKSENRARHAMNMALCSIGIYRPHLRSQALQVADAIGKVEVDHGETSCKTPDARMYIEKAALREKTNPKKRK